MEYLSIILIFAFIFSLILNYLNLSKKMSPINRINDMGIGYNLGNSFDCYDNNKDIKTPTDQITLWGNSPPTKKMILNIKKNGFKTIRFPITWFHFMDESGKVKSEWMNKVKEVVNWIISYNMYCIINVHHDGKSGNWLSKGIESKKKFDYLWSQIAVEFKNYDEYLVFESMNEVEFKSGDNYDYNTLLIFSQSFVDIVRNSGGKNSERLLLISGANADCLLTIDDGFQMPVDPANYLAVSIHYNIPVQFTRETNSTNEDKMVSWGLSGDYDEIMMYFYIMRVTFVDRGIPIILGQIGVVTEDDEKNKESIREYLYVVFALAWEFDGVMACLWDTSNKENGDMNFYNRDTNKWYDDRIITFLQRIGKGKFVSMWANFIYSNMENVTENLGENFDFDIEDLTLIEITFSIKYVKDYSDVGIEIYTLDGNGESFQISFGVNNAKKQYDGSILFVIDTRGLECYDELHIIKLEGYENIVINYYSVKYEEYVNVFDYKSYRNEVLSNIN